MMTQEEYDCCIALYNLAEQQGIQIDLQQIIKLSQHANISNLIISNLIHLEEAKGLTENEMINISSITYLRDWLSRAFFTFDEIKGLTENQILNLNEFSVFNLIDMECVTIEEAKDLTESQREKISYAFPLVTEGLLTLEETINLTENQILNLSESDIRSLILDEFITLEEAKHLSEIQRKNLLATHGLIEYKCITVEEAKNLTQMQRDNICQEFITILIKENYLSVHNVMALNKIISEGFATWLYSIKWQFKQRNKLNIFNSILDLSEDQIEILKLNWQKISNDPKDLLSSQTIDGANLKLLSFMMLLFIEKSKQEYLEAVEELNLANEAESSMESQKVKKANKRFNLLHDYYNEKLTSSGGIASCEPLIRKKLLKEIKINAEDGKNVEILNFLGGLSEKEIESIADLTNEILLAKCRELFTSNEDIAQIAFRAYDPQSKKIGLFPNLLTPPDVNRVNDEVFSTRESTEAINNQNVAPLTSKEVSLYVRRNAALCFLAGEDENNSRELQEAIWKDFIMYVAEIRRAHNDTVEGIDDPSCLPGTMSRLAQSVNKHRLFVNDNQDVQEVIRNAITTYIDRQLDQALNEAGSPQEKQRLFFSLMMLGLGNAQEILNNNFSAVSVFLDNVDEDENVSDVEFATIIQEYVNSRAAFFRKLLSGQSKDPENLDLVAYVKNHLEQNQMGNENLAVVNYFINLAIANLPSLKIGPSKKQQEAMGYSQSGNDPSVDLQTDNYDDLVFSGLNYVTHEEASSSSTLLFNNSSSASSRQEQQQDEASSSSALRSFR